MWQQVGKSDVLPQVYCSLNLQKQLKLRVLEDPTTKQESSCDNSHDNHHSAKEGSYNFHGCALGISASPSGDLLSFLDDKVILFFKPEFTYVAS